MISSLIMVVCGTFLGAAVCTSAMLLASKTPVQKAALFFFCWLPVLALSLLLWAHNNADQIDALMGVAP